VRIEIERDGAAKMATHFASDAGEYLFSSFPLFFFFIRGFGVVGSRDELRILFLSFLPEGV
jgi:hypothetical protein